MKILGTICKIVGAVYIVLAVLGSLDVIDMHTCVSDAGRCHVTVSPRGAE